MGSAAGGLCGIHRQIGALEQGEQVRTVTRRDGNANAGVAAEAVTEAVERRSKRLVDSCDQLADVAVADHVALDDGEFIPAQPRNKVARSDGFKQPSRHTPQEFIADQLTQRIIDALELVDVDVEDRELDIGGLQQQPLGIALEQRAVRQTRQRIVVRKMFELGRDAPQFGDIFQRGRPAAIGRSLVDQPNHPPVRGRDHGIVDHVILRIEKPGAIVIDVADERAELLAMQDEVAKVAAGLNHIGRDSEHVDVVLIADHDGPRRRTTAIPGSCC